jgi:hypothetical protein
MLENELQKLNACLVDMNVKVEKLELNVSGDLDFCLSTVDKMGFRVSIEGVENNYNKRKFVNVVFKAILNKEVEVQE